MTRYALIYGIIAGGIAAAVLTISIASGSSNHTTSLWFGYLVMLVALSLIFVGIKRYRDIECGGVIRFGRAFLLGLAIAAVAGLIYALIWESYKNPLFRIPMTFIEIFPVGFLVALISAALLRNAKFLPARQG